MNTRYLIVGAIILALAGGAALYFSSNPTLTKLTPLESSPITETLALAPSTPIAGATTTLTFSFTRDGKPAQLRDHHGHKVHVVIVGADLETIGHIHPADFTNDLSAEIASGTYTVQYAFPSAGTYIVAADVMDASSTLSQQYLVRVGGAPAMGSVNLTTTSSVCVNAVPFDGTSVDQHVEPISVAAITVACADGYAISLDAGDLTEGVATQLKFTVTHKGVPVTDLNPYLNAALHLAIIPSSLDFALHKHGDAASAMNHDHTMQMSDAMPGMQMDMHEVMPPSRFGPDLVSESIVFPKPGIYRIFAQMKRGNELIVAPFMVTVGASQKAQSKTKSFNLTVKDGKVIAGSGDITVSQGDTVSLTVTNDKDEEVHLHGYNKMVDVKAGEPGTITFVANASGRFPFELEDEKIELGAISVMPQ